MLRWSLNLSVLCHHIGFLQVFAASSSGFQCTGFEINSILVAYARSRARWTGVPPSQATFVKKDFWKVRNLNKNYYSLTLIKAFI